MVKCANETIPIVSTMLTKITLQRKDSSASIEYHIEHPVYKYYFVAAGAILSKALNSSHKLAVILTFDKLLT